MPVERGRRRSTCAFTCILAGLQIAAACFTTLPPRGHLSLDNRRIIETVVGRSDRLALFALIICVILQLIALVWYAASYIPFAQRMLKNCCGGCCDFDDGI